MFYLTSFITDIRLHLVFAWIIQERVGNENNHNVNTRKQNDYFVTTVFEIQNFSVAFEMLLKISKKIVSRSIN